MKIQPSGLFAQLLAANGRNDLLTGFDMDDEWYRSHVAEALNDHSGEDAGAVALYSATMHPNAPHNKAARQEPVHAREVVPLPVAAPDRVTRILLLLILIVLLGIFARSARAQGSGGVTLRGYANGSPIVGSARSAGLFGIDCGASTAFANNILNCPGTASLTVQTDGTNNASQSVLNLQSSSATNGLTLTFTNSGGNVKLGLTGTLNNSGLTNSTMTVNGTTCTLGASCTLGNLVPVFGYFSPTFNASTTNNLFLNVTGPGQGGSVTESSRQNVVPSGTVQKLLVSFASANIGAGDTFTVTLRKNGSSTAISCTVAASGQTCSDTSHSVTTSDGDLLDYLTTTTGSSLPASVSMSISLSMAS